MTEADPSITPGLFAIQLEEVFCVSSRAERRDRTDADPEDLKAARIELSSTGLDDDRRRFRSRLEVGVVAPVLDQEVADITVVVQGHFLGENEITDEAHEEFVGFTPMVQLYPYARGYLADLARMLGVTLPPLPLITVSQPPSDADWSVASEGEPASAEGVAEPSEST